VEKAQLESQKQDRLSRAPFFSFYRSIIAPNFACLSFLRLSLIQAEPLPENRKWYSFDPVENLEHAVALHFMHYNFCRVHQSLRVTPAMEAGVSDHVWSLEEVIALLD
jgi:hypothetical protein